MSTKTTHIFSLILSLILLYGCTSPRAHPPTQLLTLEPASLPSPFANNDVLISFIRDASDGMDEISSCLNAFDTYRFVLDQDGHLIRFDETHYVETRISQTEIDKLLSEIDATGFSSLTGDGDQYIPNAPPPSFKNTWGGSITVNKKTITITPGQSDYLVEAVIKTLAIIENYKPKNLQLYAPEGITLWVFLEENLILGPANPTPEPPVLKWSIDEIDLANLAMGPFTNQPQMIKGETLAFLLRQVKTVPAFRRVEQNGQSYYVLVCPNFPQ